MTKSISEIIKLLENIEQGVTEQKPTLSIDRLISKIEGQLPYESRYKSVDYDENAKILYWVTQESSGSQNQEVAEQIAEMLKNNGYTGWTVKVVVRDYYSGEDSPWRVATTD